VKVKSEVKEMLDKLSLDATIEEEVSLEIAYEEFRAKVEQKKKELLTKKSFRQKLFPFKIEVTRL